MDSQDQTKTHSSGHENHGVHLCHKCGWPFPNPHPSARHRRAHKRICGTVEGYKLMDSEENTHLTLSDDEHPFDEDRKTPSPKSERRSNNETGSGGIGERSNRSGDEMFSDAITEFLNGECSPGIEELSKGASESTANAEKVMEDDPNINHSLKDNAIADIIQPPDNPSDSSQMQSPEGSESAINHLRSTAQSDDLVSSSSINSGVSSASDTRIEDLASGICPDRNGSACDLPPIKSETPMEASKEITNAKASENATKCSMTFIGQEIEAKGNEKNNVDRNLSDIALRKAASKPSEEDSKLTEMDDKISDLVPADGIVESKDEQSHGLGPNISQSDISPEVKSVEHVDSSINTAQIEVDSAQEIDVGRCGDLVEGHGMKGEGNEKVHMLSVPDDIRVKDRSEIMVEDFKDHKALKLNFPVTLDSSEAIRDMEDDSRDHISEESCSGLQSSQWGESIDVSSSTDMHALEDNLKQEGGGDKLRVEEEPVEGRADISEFEVTSGENLGSNGVEAPPDVARSETEEIQTVRCFVGQESHESHNDSSQKTLAEYTTMNFADRTPMVTFSDAEVKTTNLVGGDGAGDHEKDKIKKCDIAGNADAARSETEESQTVHSVEGQEPHESHKDSSKKILLEYTTMNFADMIPMVTFADAEVNQATNLVGGDGACDRGKDKIENGGIAGNDSEEGAIEEKLTKNTTTPPESAGNLSLSQVNQTTKLPGDEDAGDDHEKPRIKKCDIPGNESGEGVTGENLAMDTKITCESASGVSESQVVADDGMDEIVRNLQETEFTHLDRVSDSSGVGIDARHLGNITETHSSLQNCRDDDSPKAVKELEINNNNEVQAECVGAVSTVAESNHGGDVELLKKTPENQMIKEPLLSPVDAESPVQSSATVEDNLARELDGGASGICSESLQEERDKILIKEQVVVSGLYISVDSSSQTDSLEGNWGSVSDAPAVIDAEALPLTDSQASAEAEKANLKKPKAAPEGHCPDKSDIFEPPSFMTLVEPRGGGDQRAASEIETVQNPQQPESASLQAGWFPSLTHVVSESQGRKKNEEIIAKVTNWSTSTGKQHTPLKSLLGEANWEPKPKPLNPKENPTPVIQKDETLAKNNGASATTVNSILGPEASVAQASKRETGKEWNSPARYPTDSKRERRKVKGKPYWGPFVCCSSVN